MLSRDDTESEVVRRVAYISLGIIFFFTLTEVSSFAFRIAHAELYTFEHQALCQVFILMFIITSNAIAILLVIASKKSIPKIEPFLRKLCHNDSYWLCIFTILLIAYTTLFIAYPDFIAMFDGFTHM